MFGLGLGNAFSQDYYNQLAQQATSQGMGGLQNYIAQQNMARDAAEVERLRKLAEEEQQLLCLLTSGD